MLLLLPRSINIQSIAEYIWNYLFYQDGSIELEIRLTGILQAYVSGPNEQSPYGVQVAPGITAQNHQHIFSLRVDSMIDGLSNSVVETDVLPIPHATGSERNYAGNGFRTHERVLKEASEGARDWDAATDRRWRIVNSARKHYATGQPVGYSLGVKGGVTAWLPRPDGWVGERARFASKTMWVMRDDEQVGTKGGRMWPAGKYVPQARGEPEDSVGKWLEKDGKEGKTIEDEDLVVFLTVGTTHIPRPEDWPV